MEVHGHPQLICNCTGTTPEPRHQYRRCALRENPSQWDMLVACASHTALGLLKKYCSRLAAGNTSQTTWYQGETCPHIHKVRHAQLFAHDGGERCRAKLEVTVYFHPGPTTVSLLHLLL